jgi:hypothetical protein
MPRAGSPTTAALLQRDATQAGYFRTMWIRFFEALGRMCYDASDQIIALYEANRLRQVQDGAEASRTFNIANGIDVVRFGALRALRPEKVPPIMCLIGRVVPIKDIKTYIRATRIIANRFPDAQAWIAGPEEESPEYAKECKELVASLGLGQNVKFLGFQKLTDLLPQIGLVVLSSISEALPLVILEGYAAGVPTVSTDVGSCRQLVYGLDEEDRALGASGEVVGIADPQALAEAAMRLLGDEAAWHAGGPGRHPARGALLHPPSDVWPLPRGVRQGPGHGAQRARRGAGRLMAGIGFELRKLLATRQLLCAGACLCLCGADQLGAMGAVHRRPGGHRGGLGQCVGARHVCHPVPGVGHLPDCGLADPDGCGAAVIHPLGVRPAVCPQARTHRAQLCRPAAGDQPDRRHDGRHLALTLFRDETAVYRMLMVAGFVTMCDIWVATIFMSGLKFYKTIVGLFAGGYGASVVLAILLRPWGLEGLLCGYVVGQFLMLAGMFFIIVRSFPAERMVAFDCFARGHAAHADGRGPALQPGHLDRQDRLLVCADTGMNVIGPLRASVIYDMPVFLAYLSIIPGMAVFLVRFETDFVEWYDKFYNAVREGGSLEEIARMRDEMVFAMRHGLFDIVKMQTLAVLVMVVFAPAIFDKLGISGLYLPLFYVDAVAASLQVALLAVMNVFFYLDRRRAVLAVVTLLTVLNFGLSMLSLRLGAPFTATVLHWRCWSRWWWPCWCWSARSRGWSTRPSCCSR